MSMKTRQEMVYEFMLAIASNYDAVARKAIEHNKEFDTDYTVAEQIVVMAKLLADEYLEYTQ